jgi:hypothetical protein
MIRNNRIDVVLLLNTVVFCRRVGLIRVGLLYLFYLKGGYMMCINYYYLTDVINYYYLTDELQTTLGNCVVWSLIA